MKQSGRMVRILLKGIRGLTLRKVREPRRCHGRKWSLWQLLEVVLVGICAGAQSLAQVEALTVDLSSAVRRVLRLGRRVPDTTMRDVLVRLSPTALRGVLWNQIKAAVRRKALMPDGLPFGVVSLDGKGTAIKSWEHNYAQKQRHAEGGGASGVVRTFTAALVSSRVPVCIDAAIIPPDTNEDGIFTRVVARLLRLYRRCDLFRLVVADAGSCSLANATYLGQHGLRYLFTLNDKQKTLFKEAKRVLGPKAAARALAVVEEKIGGGIERRTLFLTTEMEAFLDWTHLRTVLRVQREVLMDGRPAEVHDRYFVSSLRHDALTPAQWLKVIRGHWAAVENGCHKIADVAFAEDKHPWITHDDQGMLNVLILRRIAYNLVALARGVTLRSDDNRNIPWLRFLRLFYNGLVAATRANIIQAVAKSQAATATANEA